MAGDNVRLRVDGRYEARYAKGRNEKGRIIYGCCYGRTYEEAVKKRQYLMQRLNSKKNKRLNLIILGAGVYGEEVYDIAKSLHVFHRIEFLDDNPFRENTVGSWNEVEDYLEEFPVAVIAVADVDLRKDWTNKLIGMGFIIPTLIHPTAYVPEGVEVGIGTVICARVTVSAGSKIGDNCIITSGSIIPRKTVLPDWAYFEIDKWEFHREKYEIPKLEKNEEK